MKDDYGQNMQASKNEVNRLRKEQEVFAAENEQWREKCRTLET